MLLAATLLFVPATLAPEAPAALPPALPGTLRVYLVRHGQALSNLDPAPDLPPEQLDHLTNLGRQQAERAGKALAGRGVSLVLTSPASRARETAERMATAMPAPAPTVEPRLRPLSLGQGKDGRALDWDERIAEWKAGRDPVPPGGESLEQVGARVTDLVAALWKEGRGRSVVLVAHGEVIGSYLGALRGIPAPERYPPDLANGSITVIDVGPDGIARLVIANHRPAVP